ncbi:MAG: MFS transporter [Myxococcales bacterium]|nr:MFS transporter [Myxococcales bacterium]
MSEPVAEPANARRRLPAAVIALGVTSFFADVGSEMIFPLLPVFVASLGASTTFLGLVEGLADATSSLLKLASGYVADHTRRKKPLVLFGYGAAALVRPLVALATAPWHVLAVRVTDRVGKGIRSAPRDVLIASSVSGAETGRAFGFHRAMDHAGAVVGPLIATALLGLGWPLRHVFWVALIPGVLSVIAVATVREPHVEVAAHEPTRTGEPIRLPGSLRSYLAILLLFSLGNSSDAFLLLRARDLGVPIAALPLLWTVFHVAKLVSSYLGGGWSDRIARPKLIVTGWIVYAATYLAFGLATQSWHAWALFIIYGTYYGLTEPAEKALVKDLAPSAVRGRAYGFYNFIIGVSAVPAGVLTGWLWQTWSPLVALAAGAGVAAASSIALIVWGSGTNHARAANE